jgi:REP element-mobilizing transposase RayT
MNSRTRGYLPHYDVPQGIYFVTFRLADSLSYSLVKQWQEKLKLAYTADASKNLNYEYQEAVQNFLDTSSGNCWLKKPEVASIVDGAIRYFDQQRYNLFAWTIMPNHVHVLFQMKDGYQISQILHSWKSYSAHQANKLLKRTGEFWQHEYFDTSIQSERQLEFTLRYILNNPVKAGLCAEVSQWPWTKCCGDMQYLAHRFFL